MITVAKNRLQWSLRTAHCSGTLNTSSHLKSDMHEVVEMTQIARLTVDQSPCTAQGVDCSSVAEPY